jgi:putative transposase
MGKKRHSGEQIIAIVKQCEAGRRVPHVAREHGVSEGTIYGWKSNDAGMDVADAKRLRGLEEENRRLK